MSESEIIPTFESDFDGQQVQAVDARVLHGLLEISYDFSTWLKNRIKQLNLIEGMDYIVFQQLLENPQIKRKNLLPKTGEQKQSGSNKILLQQLLEQDSGWGGSNKIDYHVSIDIAKHLCMVEKNDAGHKIRMWFIEIEKKYRAQQINNAARTVFLLDKPSEWEKLFPVEFFEELSRMYHRTFDGMKSTPAWFGHVINSYIYKPLWDELSDELKAKRTTFAGEDEKTLLKLHQFLNETARDQVSKQIERVIGLMMVCEDMEQFRTLYARRIELKNQLLLPLKK